VRPITELRSVLLALLLAWLLPSHGLAEAATEARDLTATFSNPVISGFAPDPSICRAGDDFYLVNSSFEYFPGIPVYHSRDLVNWKLIGYALHDPAQADLSTVKSSDGIHASTIRCHQGRFYVITTNNIDGKLVNFVVTAEDPAGPWSAPQIIDGAPGIDPSLFFDDDGRAWYVGNHVPPDPEFPGQAEIWLQEIDPQSMTLVGDRHYLWRGCCGGTWAEGPHIYKRNGFYYLLISEGGTSYEHALAIAVSKEITGPYQNNPRNPVLSHRQLSYGHPITGVGHADLVELPDGRWYAVALGWRLIDGVHGILGRETFLLPVSWETEPHAWKEERLDFPVFSPLTGKLELRYPLPFADSPQAAPTAFSDDFEGPGLALEWNFRRSPTQPFLDLSARPGALRLQLQRDAISDRVPYGFAGIRQRHFRFEASTRLEFEPAGAHEEAGILVIQNDRSAFLATLAGSDGGSAQLRLQQIFQGQNKALAELPFEGDELYLRVSGDYLDYRFAWSGDGSNWQELGPPLDGSALSPAVLGGFNYTGVYLGLYASSNGKASDNHADFDFFHYAPAAVDRNDWYHRQRQRQNQQHSPE
jgi:alpha-N-arabinofuranosidase